MQLALLKSPNDLQNCKNILGYIVSKVNTLFGGIVPGVIDMGLSPVKMQEGVRIMLMSLSSDLKRLWQKKPLCLAEAQMFVKV